MKYQKGGCKIYSRTRTFGAEVHRSNIRVKSMEIVNYIGRRNFCWKDFLTKSNRTEIQTYKVEERTFRTPYIYGLYRCFPSCISGFSRIIAAWRPLLTKDKSLYKKTNFKKVGFSIMAFTTKILSWRFRHQNIVGCLLKRRPTKGGHERPRTPPSYALGSMLNLLGTAATTISCIRKLFGTHRVWDCFYYFLSS